MCILYKSIGTSGYRNPNSGWARLSLVRFPDPLWVNIGSQCSWLGLLVPYTLCNGTLHWRRQTVLLDWMNLRSEGMILMELDFPQKRKITRICISLMTLFDPQQHFEIALYGYYFIWKAISLHNKYFACHVEQNCPTWQAILLHVVCIIMIYTVLRWFSSCPWRKITNIMYAVGPCTVGSQTAGRPTHLLHKSLWGGEGGVRFPTHQRAGRAVLDKGSTPQGCFHFCTVHSVST